MSSSPAIAIAAPPTAVPAISRLGNALQVAEDLASLGDHSGHGAEVAAHEHEVGDALCHLRAAPLGDRQPCLLERGYVVDPVAQHRDIAPLVAQGGHHTP